MEVLKGQLLISQPFMDDSNFERTVILICEINPEGAFGFVMNRQIQVGLSQVYEILPKAESALFIGGPVEQNTLHFIHKYGSNIEGSQHLADDIWWGGNFDQLCKKLYNSSILPTDTRFFLGYSGWQPAQLEQEINEGSWIICPSLPPNLLDIEPEKLWAAVLKHMGGNYRQIANYPKDPRLN